MNRRRTHHNSAAIATDPAECDSVRSHKHPVQQQHEEDEGVLALLEGVAEEAAEVVGQLEDSLCQWWQDLVVRPLGALGLGWDDDSEQQQHGPDSPPRPHNHSFTHSYSHVYSSSSSSSSPTTRHHIGSLNQQHDTIVSDFICPHSSTGNTHHTAYSSSSSDGSSSGDANVAISDLLPAAAGSNAATAAAAAAAAFRQRGKQSTTAAADFAPWEQQQPAVGGGCDGDGITNSSSSTHAGLPLSHEGSYGPQKQQGVSSNSTGGVMNALLPLDGEVDVEIEEEWTWGNRNPKKKD